MKKSMTATDARKNFFKLIEIAGKPGRSVVITREGMPDVVMLSAEEFEGWQETLEIMSYNDPAMDKDILEGIKEMKSGKRPKDTVSFEALKKGLAR
jgi:prevent-host-death family protein